MGFWNFSFIFSINRVYQLVRVPAGSWYNFFFSKWTFPFYYGSEVLYQQFLKWGIKKKRFFFCQRNVSLQIFSSLIWCIRSIQCMLFILSTATSSTKDFSRFFCRFISFSPVLVLHNYKAQELQLKRKYTTFTMGKWHKKC